METKRKQVEVSTETVDHSDGKYVVRSPYPNIDIPEKTFVQLIMERKEAWKDLTAVVCCETGESYTYDQLFERSMSIGRALLDEGLKEGDVVAFVLNNSPEYAAAILGASGFGLVVSSVSPLFKADEVAFQLKTSNVKCILTCPERAQVVKDAVSQLSDNETIIVRRIGCRTKETSSAGADCGIEVLVETDKRNDAFVNRTKGLDKTLAVLLYSSGTTGLPKGVCLSHKNITAAIVQLAHKQTAFCKDTTDNIQDNVLLIVPMYHVYGFGVLLQSLYHGSKIAILSKFEGKSFLKAMEKYEISVLATVPPIIQFMGLRDEVTKNHLKYLRCIIIGAAPSSEKDVRKLLSKTPSDINLIQGFGQTESTSFLTFVPYGVDNMSSIGRPVVNMEIVVIDLENGRPQPAYKTGEICFRGSQVFMGYLNDEKSTNEVIDARGWCHTGDVGYYDENGYFYIVDRIKELIKVKGFQVAPAELEAVLRSHPKVEDAAVTGIPDERTGEAPVGFVKVKDGERLSEQDLKNFLSARVAPYKVIDVFHFVDVIPKSPSGKIMRKELKESLK